MSNNQKRRQKKSTKKISLYYDSSNNLAVLLNKVNQLNLQSKKYSLAHLQTNSNNSKSRFPLTISFSISSRNVKLKNP